MNPECCSHWAGYTSTVGYALPLFTPSSVCVEHVIIAFPSWAAMVYNYQAFNVINQEGGSYNSKLKASTFLKKALSLLETEREAVLRRNQILKAISDVSRSGGTSLHPDCFKIQNDGEVQCLSVLLVAWISRTTIFSRVV